MLEDLSTSTMISRMSMSYTMRSISQGVMKLHSLVMILSNAPVRSTIYSRPFGTYTIGSPQQYGSS